MAAKTLSVRVTPIRLYFILQRVNPSIRLTPRKYYENNIYHAKSLQTLDKSEFRNFQKSLLVYCYFLFFFFYL